MKILFLVNSSAGFYSFRKELAESLIQEYSVVLCTPNGDRIDYFQQLGCEIRLNEYLELRGTNPLKDWKLYRYYYSLLQKEKPDCVCTYTIKPNVYGGMACSALKIPYIANITGLGSAVESGGWIQKITLPLYRHGLRKAAMVFFQNQENLDFMLKHKIVSGAWDLLPGSGVNLKGFQPLDYPNGDTVDFTFISRILKEKGIDQYLEAAEAISAKHPETRFHVYGPCDNEYQEILEQYQAKGIIQYHGYTKDIVGVHRNSCCTIHPTYYPEGMSNVLLESAACARPVITTDRPGCIETVDDGVTGFVVGQKDTSDLIQKIEHFLSMSWEERRDMGLSGRKKMERQFDRNIVVRKYLDAIHKITN